MAYDKIFVIRARLDKRLRYVMNPEKCTAPDTAHVLQAALNCQLDTALADMRSTKRRWDKENGVQGYHIIHAYMPGEVTPEQAQALGVEFASRLLGDRFEAVVTTHTDRPHLHCHIIFNSVSFADGKMYRNDFKAYFEDIRGTSNAVSQENGLSVIEPQGRGKNYAEWQAEQDGKATVRRLVRQDIDAAITDAFTLQSLFQLLQRRGYAIKRGPTITHTAVRPPGGSRFIRLDSLGEAYTEATIQRRLTAHRDGGVVSQAPPAVAFIIPMPKGRSYTVRRGDVHHPRKLCGWRAMYVRYLYLLGSRGRSLYKKPVPFDIRKEITRLETYKRQFRLLQKYRIEDSRELSMLADALQTVMEALTDQRRELYALKRQGVDTTGKITEITEAMRPIRKETRLCRQIAETVPTMRAQLEKARQEPERTKQQTKSQERRDRQWR